jgi:hypothetical protein
MSQGGHRICTNQSRQKNPTRETFTTESDEGATLKPLFPVTKGTTKSIKDNAPRCGNDRMSGRNVPFHRRAKTRIEIRTPFRDKTKLKRGTGRNPLRNRE